MQTQNWLLKQASLKPNAPAVITEDQCLTFTQLAKLAAKRAGKIAQTTQNTRVGLLGDNSLSTYVLALALLFSGKTIVWLNFRLSTAELMAQIDDSELDLCLVTDELWRSEFTELFLPYSQLEASKAPAKELMATVELDAIASIMYTSGTTGQAKGVMQSFGNHFYSAVASALNLGLSATDQWLCAVPLFHISGFSILMRGLIYGMPVRLVKRFDPSLVETILVSEPVTIISAVPYMLQELLKQHVTPYNPKFRLVLLGGSSAPKELLVASKKAQVNVVQCYGMTETCSQVVALSSEYALDKLGSVGKPLFTTQVKLDPTTSELLLKSPALVSGYLNRPELFAKKLDAGWYHTGDVAHFDQDGFLYIDGRLDEMLVSGGENIFPQEIEQCYRKLPKISEIIVVGRPDPTWGEVPIAFVRGQKLAQATLRTYGEKYLAHYKIPKEFIWVKDFPKTASGKVKRYLLRGSFLNG
ncbi:o-succinylbenzoate--CoA ligase [Ligilactobacillus animalis]|uniref:o-succinylbenzoate--CoA ligase n=1 Tax=Ligilactobacillus animalis TaxID=1605 RepID=UPI000825ADF4|nr:o-succinylbenzoate--CoA ligase [Ligilactobacillus animalis]OCX47542.1 o-succinylbenzoate--CoA ligase [Ligilactobacillus animalis]QHQ69440.1 o-succinylbenzoate--CoA ligase [Ligilactobacillus animalis]